MDIDVETIRDWHVNGNGWSDVGYHYFIQRDGTIEYGRDIERVGAHVRGHNKHSIGICYAGGIDERGKPEDNRTRAQIKSLITLINFLRALPIPNIKNAEILGHRDFDGVKKACPCFDAKEFANRYIHG